jgi:serine/threonine protein kinase
MDPTKEESSLDPAWDHVHFVASDLPELLPKPDEVERRFRLSGRLHGDTTALHLNENSNYMVKRNRNLVMEGWTMLYLRKMTSIPLPTVYAILTNKTANRDIIIMEYIPHPSLEKTWPTLEVAEKEDTAKQLAAYLTEVRALPHPGFFGRWVPHEFGNLDKEPLGDLLFQSDEEEHEGCLGGPFDTVQQFAKGLEDALNLNPIEPARREFFARLIPTHLLTESRPVFTHGDLQLRNIIRKQNGQVVIIDWGLCGWYPVWWEYCYTAWAANYKTDWPTYIPKFLSEHPKEFCLFSILRTLYFGFFVA